MLKDDKMAYTPKNKKESSKPVTNENKTPKFSQGEVVAVKPAGAATPLFGIVLKSRDGYVELYAKNPDGDLDNLFIKEEEGWDFETFLKLNQKLNQLVLNQKAQQEATEAQFEAYLKKKEAAKNDEDWSNRGIWTRHHRAMER